MKIVVSEHLPPEALARLQNAATVHYDAELFKNRTELKRALADADALVVRNGTRVDAELLEGAKTLKVVGRLGVGLDNLMLDELRARDITVTWAPGANAVSVAEYVMGAMLELSRRFASISAEAHGGVWDRQGAIGAEIYGTTLGIVGLGDIGSRLAKRAAAFGMKVLASDPVVHDNSFAVQEYGLEVLELTALLERADFVSLHAPLLPSTRHLINAETLASFKPSAYLINTARGGLVDEQALATALRQGKLAGAALDVRENEPPGNDDPLRGLENVLLTPHIAGVTEASNLRVSLHVANDVLRVLSGSAPLSVPMNRVPGSV